jgi:hypothetical protein
MDPDNYSVAHAAVYFGVVWKSTMLFMSKWPYVGRNVSRTKLIYYTSQCDQLSSPGYFEEDGVQSATPHA